MMNGVSDLAADSSEFVEVDPTGRYGRYNEILGKGASKTVYKAFDEYEGIEVAWNQVKLYDFLQSPEDLERLYCEIHLLKTLKHQNIMKFYTSWVDIANRNINFVTEMFTSGTLRQYRLKHKRVNIRAVKHWCRQILNGLLYLHSHDPPVIHRDLKCDNIFINGNQGEVKIGDLGLAAILRKSHADHCVGTPEFMAPEVYEEEYNELVDIYAFGMCILEMVTLEYPYTECTHPAQIYKKVISGKKPDALYKVKDPEVRQFVEKCLATVSRRLSARELLDDPFLQIDDRNPDFRPIDTRRELGYMDPLLRQPFLDLDYEVGSCSNSSYNAYSNGNAFEDLNGWVCDPYEFEQSGIELFEYNDNDADEDSPHINITIKGKKKPDGKIYLRLRISDKEGRIRNIYFRFDIESDTALSVATEMVAELDMTDHDVTKIADMIDGEIAKLVPEWEQGPGIEETPRFANSGLCHNCMSNHTSTGSLVNFLANIPGGSLQFLPCNGCAATHGRFEEITFQVNSPRSVVSDDASDTPLSRIDNFHNMGFPEHRESLECSSLGSVHSLYLEESEKSDQEIPTNGTKDVGAKDTISFNQNGFIKSLVGSHSSHDLTKPLETEQTLRWLRAKYQKKLRELGDQRLGFVDRSPRPSARRDREIKNGVSSHETLFGSSETGKTVSSCLNEYFKESCPLSVSQRAREREANDEPGYTPDAITTNSFYMNSLLPQTIQRTTSLPVDAVDL